MTFRFQSMIKRADLRENPDVIYLFGDNDQRSGYGGQAEEMRGEPNARGVRTKKAPSRRPDAFFSDAEFEENRLQIDNDLFGLWDHLAAGGDVVCPMNGLGTGLSDLAATAPRTNNFLRHQLENLHTHFGYERHPERLESARKCQPNRSY